jgi:hypothetical protein
MGVKVRRRAAGLALSESSPFKCRCTVSLTAIQGIACNDQQNVGSESFATGPFYGLLHSASWFHAKEPSNIGCLYVAMEPLAGYELRRLARALHG